MSWASKRVTTLKEDKAYCLLGLFGVFLPLIYGEGEEHAVVRLQEEISKRTRGQKTSPTANRACSCLYEQCSCLYCHLVTDNTKILHRFLFGTPMN